MGQEIERKFLVQPGWRPTGAGERIAQGYLCSVPERTVRVRLRAGHGYLTVKGRNNGIARAEYEYEIPAGDAEAMLALCEPVIIDKTRYIVKAEDSVYEVDVFAGANAGLVVAEIELPAMEADFVRPDWLGPEVSGDPRYYNSALAHHPYSEW